MFRMLTCFNLAEEATVAQFDVLLRRFSNDLVRQDLLSSTGPIGRRYRHPVMDTDAERDHEYFFLMDFDSLSQCDAAVARFQAGDAETEPDHVAMQAMVKDPVFICWEELPDD